jgi:GntR family transcriptional regulator
MITAPRPVSDRAQGGPMQISLTSRGPAQAGDRARVLGADVVHAPRSVAAELGTEPGAEVIRRHQVTVRGEGTAAVLISWFPATLAEAAPDLLRKARLAGQVNGYEPAWGEDWVSARPPTSVEARDFGIKRGSPVVVVHSRRFAADDSVLEYAELVARADAHILYRYDYVTPDTR